MADDIEVRSEGGRFAMVPRWVHRSGLSDGAVRLYLALADRADYDTHSARFSRRVLAADIGVTEVKTVTRRLKELVDFGAVIIERIVSEEHGNEISRYVLIQFDPRVTNDPRGGQKRPRPRTRTTPAPVADDPSPRVTNDPAYNENQELRDHLSSSGPVHQPSTPHRHDDDPKPAPPPPPPDETRAREAAVVLGVHDSRAAFAAGVAVGAFVPHARSCAETRWALLGAELLALARDHPLHDSHALARLVLDHEHVAAASGAPPGRTATATGPTLHDAEPCPHCRALGWCEHQHPAEPHVRWEDDDGWHEIGGPA